MPEKTPRLRIDLASPTPAYRQIVDGLRTILVSGGMHAGDMLPPVRSAGAARKCWNVPNVPPIRTNASSSRGGCVT